MPSAIKLTQWYVLIPCLLLLAACGERSRSQETYIDTGDLDALQERGVLRLIAPRFDGENALPREGIPVQNYQYMAEEFCASLGLTARWVFIDAFDELIPVLESGRGDLIVTNLTETDARRKRVDFSRPINRVDEVIVGPSKSSVDDLSALTGVTLTIPEGTAYVESLVEYNDSNDNKITFNIVSSTNSDSDLLAGIVDGHYQATVLDSNIARSLLLDYPDLKTGATLKKNRPIAWAVRKNNQNLLRALNEFLVAHFVGSSAVERENRNWAEIRKNGRLRMLTLNNPASYFMWRGELMGFDYDLARHFAKQHDLYLSVVIKDSIPELFSALKKGEGDFIAASLTRSGERESQGVSFSRPYLLVAEQLVGRVQGPAIEKVEQLAGMRIGVNPDTVFYQRFKTLLKEGMAFELVEYPGVLTEELFDRLVANEFDFMPADGHLVAIELAHSDAIRVNFNLGDESKIAWVVRKDQTQLLSALNAFIDKKYRGLFYNVTFKKYFVYRKKIRSLQAERVTGDSNLSPYDDIVRKVASAYGMDWRLLTAQMYQESRFDPDAKSFAGARGLMQVLPRTARELGFKDLKDPKTGIEAGVAYLDWLAGRFPGNIEFQERLYFQLAAYNAGFGHVNDARRLAEQTGYDHNRWFGHVEKAILLLSKRKYYKNARYGYVRGSEPVNYVKEIRDRYLAYLSTLKI